MSDLPDGAMLNAAQLKTAALVVAPTGITPASVTATMDRTVVPVGSRGGDRIVPTRGLSDGTHRIQVRAKGLHGGTGNATMHVTVDNMPPATPRTRR